jgi:hypothetical protein
MDIQQVHYTSCRHGTAGYAGFQVRAVSNGVDPTDLEVVVRRSHYKRPLDWGDENLPVCCRFYRVPSGRFALGMVQYAGTDYSNREGNLFAHTLLFPADELKAAPASYFAWNGWKGCLDPGEDQAPPSALDLLGEDQLKREDPFTTKQLADFLSAREGRHARLRSLIRSLFLTNETGRSLVIRTDPQEALYWIALIHQCFSPKVALTIEFSSYEYAQMGLPLLTATVPGTEFSCDANQREYQFFCFDEIDGHDSETNSPTLISDYAELVAGLLEQQPESLESLFSFTEAFGCTARNADLCRAAILFAAESDPQRPISGGQLRDLAEFAQAKCPDELWERVSDLLTPRLSVLLADAPLIALGLLARSVRLAQGQPQAASTDLIETWFVLLERELRGESTSSDSERARAIIRESIPGADARLAEEVLARRNTLVEVARLGEDHARRTLHVLERSLTDLDRRPFVQQPELQEWLSDLAEQPSLMLALLPDILGRATDVQQFKDVCGLVGMMDEAEPGIRESFARLLVAHEQDFPPGALEQARREFASPLILAEWRVRIGTSTEPLQTCLDHHSVIDALPKLDRAACAAQLEQHLAAYLDNANARRRIAGYLLERGELSQFGQERARMLLESLTVGVPLDPAKRADKLLIDQLRATAEGIDPDLRLSPMLFDDLLQRARDGKQSFPIEALARYREEIASLDEEDYAYLVDQLLGAITPRRIARLSHVDLVAALHPKDTPRFTKRYREFLRKVLSEANLGDLAHFAAEWIAFNKPRTATKNQDKLYMAIEEVTKQACANRSDSEFEELKKQLSSVVKSKKRVTGFLLSVEDIRKRLSTRLRKQIVGLFSGAKK